MKRIFVIGSIGSGKSTICKMLQDELTERGFAAVGIDLDVIALAMSKNETVKQRICAEFGQFDTREDLAKIVFKDIDALTRLNEITHPYIYEQMIKNIDNYDEMGTDYVIVEETAYSGKGDRFAENADTLVCVICDDGLRQARCVEKGLPLVDFAQRTSLQVSQMTMMENADIIISNNNDAVELKEQVKELADKI